MTSRFVGLLAVVFVAPMPLGAQVTAEVPDDGTRLEVTVWRGHPPTSGTILSYHTDHAFGNVRPQLHADVLAWRRR